MTKRLVIVVLFFGAVFASIAFLTYRSSFSHRESLLPRTTEEKTTFPMQTPATTTAPIIQKPVVRASRVIPAEIQLPTKAPDVPILQSFATSSIPVVRETPSAPHLPLLDEEALLHAVVKIECPTADGQGKYVATGFVVGERTVITAAHVVKDSGSRTCSVIFPRERKPIHYFEGQTEEIEVIKKRHDEEGIDVTFITLPSIESNPPARVIFEKYPSVPYPLCANSELLEDELLHFGYPSNFVDQNYLSELKGILVAHADIKGIKEVLSEDGTYTYKSPIFSYTLEETIVHPYAVSRVPSFYGDSGGLAFDATKQCIVGPHRGGTIGKSAGENYTVFLNLGWSRAREIIKQSGAPL